MWWPQLFLLLLHRNNESVNIHCLCLRLLSYSKVLSAGTYPATVSSWIYCVTSLLCPVMCQHVRSHDTDPMNLQKHGSKVLPHYRWGNHFFCCPTGNSHQWALTGFHHNITSLNLTHDLTCQMSSLPSLFPIIPIIPHHIDIYRHLHPPLVIIIIKGFMWQIMKCVWRINLQK